MAPRGPGWAGFLALLLIALLMASNHVAARLAFDHGVTVATAVAFRSTGTALAVGALLILQRVPVALTARERRALPAIGVLIGVQSLCLYAAVARLPVVLALLVFNAFPLMTALWARLLYGHRPERTVLLAMPIILLGLVLALDVLGAASGLGAAGQWRAIGAGVGFALVAAALFGLALVLTQHEAGRLDGRVRTFGSIAVAALVAVAAALAQGGFALPTAPVGWLGLVLLMLLYGTGITLLFTVLPRLGVVGNSPVLNVEPVFALVLGWLILGQSVAPLQVLGALIVVGAVMGLGLRRRRV
ncbi:MAG: DMT family transporter [Burkholderiales bacterium]|uniref:EamA family transporter n=1 Tax=Ottowia pentelensis TaxID=511108 RepID=A0ABV6PT14_9BURK|nr:DMT family transporter [Burkholderiales bacterium]MBS0414758.1 DMT family transporter [Pseudomonadota bacterium]